MTSSMSIMAPTLRMAAQGDDLLLRETNHRCTNDLQLVVSLLALQSKRAATVEAREALADVMERVAVLARTRTAMHRERPQSLEVTLQKVCEALQPQSEPRQILISLEASHSADELPPTHIITLALVVNELITNAIKHAFQEGKSGTIKVSIKKNGADDVAIVVDDDGLPFPDAASSNEGLGMGLVRRLMVSIGGLFIPPASGSKAFELRVPVKGIRRIS